MSELIQMKIHLLNHANRFSSTNVFFFSFKNVMKNVFKNICEKKDETKKMHKIEI